MGISSYSPSSNKPVASQLPTTEFNSYMPTEAKTGLGKRNYSVAQGKQTLSFRQLIMSALSPISKALGKRTVQNASNASQEVVSARLLLQKPKINSDRDILEAIRKASNKKIIAQGDELSSVFKSAIMKQLEQTETASQIRKSYGNDAVLNILEDLKLSTVFSPSCTIEGLRRSESVDKFIAQFEDLIQYDFANAQSATTRLNNLLDKDLSASPFNGSVDESTYNFNQYDTQTSKAAAWLVYASGNERTDANVQKMMGLIDEFSDKDLRQIEVLEDLHSRLVSDIPQQRALVLGSNQPSTAAGKALLKDHISNALDANTPNLGKNLFAAVVAAQAFGDGNKRLGRTAYVISELAKGNFQPMDTQTENQLHGLGTR